MTLMEAVEVAYAVGTVIGAFLAGGVWASSSRFRKLVNGAVREAVREEVAGALAKHVEPIARDVRQLRREVVELRALVPCEGGA